MHPLPGGTPAVSGDHIALFVLIKHNSQIAQPLNGIRRLHDKSAKKLRSGGKMPASKGIQVMLYRRIVLLVCRLDSSLCHHGVCVSQAQLRHYHNPGSGPTCFDGCRGPGSSSSDYQHIHIVLCLIQIDFFI